MTILDAVEMFLCQVQEPVEVGGLPKKAFLPQLSGNYSAEAERKKFEPKRMFRKISLYKQKLINNESLGLRLLKLFVGCSELFPLQFHLPLTVLVGAAVVVALYHYLTACACVFAPLAATASTYCLRRRTTVLDAQCVLKYCRQGASLSYNAALHFIAAPPPADGTALQCGAASGIAARLCI